MGESGTRQNDAFLKGLEILKLSNPDGNLAEPNPASTAHGLTSWTSKLRRLVLAFGGGNAFINSVILILILVNVSVYHLNHLGNNFGDKHKSSSSNDELSRRFSLAEIKLATNNFDDALVVGNGGFGTVYKGSIDHGARIVAIKRLKLGSKQGALEFWTEIESLSAYQHAHLVSLIGYCDEGHEMLLVYEYMAHGTLGDHLYKVDYKNCNGNGKSPLSWEQRLKICVGAARGMDYLHTGRGSGHGLIHRDVKSSNILLDENWVAKISDFGLSKMNAANLSWTHITTDIKGTFGYLDPEYYMTRRLTRKSDVYAFGVVLFEVLCGRPAVDTSLGEEQHSLALWARHCIKKGKLDQIVDSRLREQNSMQCFNAFVEIANKCLHISPSERPTMAEMVTSLEFALERQGSPYYEIEEEVIYIGGASDEHIRGTSPTVGENMSNVGQNIANGECFSSKGTNLPRMKMKNLTSNREPTWGWRWDSLWRRAKPSKVKTPPPPEEGSKRFPHIEIRESSFTEWLR